MSVNVQGTVRWLASMRLSDHAAVERQARWLLLDTLACISAGLSYPEPQALAMRLNKSMSGPVRWPGSTLGLSAPAAAAVGAVAACWHEGCEGLARAHGRPGLHAVPVAAALGAERRATFEEVLTAIVWGYEIGARAGEAMRIRPGLHVDGTWGLFASVAAAARVLDLSETVCLEALGAAACQVPASLYAPVRAGKTARNTYAAHAALTSVLLAEGAAAGITAPVDVFDEAAKQLGSGSALHEDSTWPAEGDFLILQGYFKPYASVRHAHYAVEAALQWRARHGSDTQQIRRVIIETYQEAITYCGIRAPAVAIQAQFSLSYATAHALRTGGLGTDAYTAAALTDPEQRRLESLIELRADPSIAGRAARLRVETAAGEQVCFVDSVDGDPDRPFDETRIRDKAIQFMSVRLGRESAERVADHLLNAPTSAPFAFSGSE